MSVPLQNLDVDWDRWPVADYVAELYQDIQPEDDAVIAHHSAYYRRFGPGHFGRSLELGAGPNLYPLMLAAAVSARIEVVEPSAASVGYLERQLGAGPDESWQVFYRRCRELQPALPATLAAALSAVTVSRGGAYDVRPGHYDLASMHFVAESCTEDRDEFRDICRAYLRSVRPGGSLVAAFMENMGRYRIGTGPTWPGCPVDADIVADAFAADTTDLRISRVDARPTGPGYECTGVVLLTARRHPED